jgi:ribosomal protein L7/L12
METIGLFALLVVVLFLISGIRYRLERIQSRVTEISRIEAKIDLLLKQANIEFNPYAHVAPDIAEAVRAGEKIRAIKLYRRSTGVGLREAKEFIEGLQRRSGIG